MGGVRRGWHVVDTQRLHCRLERRTKDLIAITEEIARHLVPRKRIPELLSSPFGRRMRSDVDVDEAPAIMSQQQEHVEDLEPNGRHGEEVHGDQVLDAVLQKGAPVCEGGVWRRPVYLATLVSPISMPSLSNSPWIRGAPHNGFSRLKRRIKCLI